MTTARNRFINWATRSFPPPGKAVTLTRRRIFILPTGYGVLLALVLLLMLLAALNYDNNLALLLTFLLGGMAVNTLYFSYRNLAEIRLQSQPQCDVFAGQSACFRVGAENPTSLDRYGLVLTLNGHSSAAVDVAAGKLTVLENELPTKVRGVLQPGRFMIASLAPLGLFRTWSWQRLVSPIRVYPAPVKSREPPLHRTSGVGDAPNQSDSGEEFDRLRPYRQGDPVSHVAWKKQARTGDLMVKQYQESGALEQVYSWYALPAGNVETRLSQLCYWICRAEREGITYGLLLPTHSIAPGRGEGHRRRCLRALAEF